MVDVPTPKDRKTIGVSEGVKLIVTPSTASCTWQIIEGQGEIKDTGSTVRFYADDVAGTAKVKVTVTVDGNTINHIETFTVIAPSGMEMVNAPNHAEFHHNGIPSAGFCARVFILPNTVSFTNIKVCEGEADTVAVGYWLPLNENHHPKGTLTEVFEGDEDHPNLWGGEHWRDSVVISGEPEWPLKAGEALLNIPLIYKSIVKVGAQEKTSVNVQSHVVTDSTGETTISKGGHSVTKALNLMKVCHGVVANKNMHNALANTLRRFLGAIVFTFLLVELAGSPSVADDLRPTPIAIAKNIKLAVQSLEPDVDFAALFQVQMQILELRMDDHVALRAEKLSLYSTFISGLNRYLKKHPDEKKEMTANVPLPDGVPGFNGMAPEAIKDPIKRAQYEKKIAENSRRMRAASNHHLASRMRTQLRQDAAEFCAKAYGKSQKEQAALRKDITNFSDVEQFLTMVQARR